jgi:hypothetical protein
MTYYDDNFPQFCYPWHIFSRKGGFDAKKESVSNCAIGSRACRAGKDCPEIYVTLLFGRPGQGDFDGRPGYGERYDRAEIGAAPADREQVAETIL